MSKYCEGNRVIDAVTDTPILASLSQDAENQLAVMLGPRELGVTRAAQPPSGWTYDFSNNYWAYDGSTAAPNDRMRFQLSLYAGQKLTEVHIAVEAVTKGTVGDLILGWRSKTPSGGSMPSFGTSTLISDLWNLSADNYAELQSATGLTTTFSSGYNYFLDITPRTGVVCIIHEVTVVAQFGN